MKKIFYLFLFLFFASFVFAAPPGAPPIGPGTDLVVKSLNAGGTHFGNGYGLRWNATGDAYVLGSLTNGYFQPSSSLITFPVQENMKRCVLDDAGVVEYYLEDDDSYNKYGVAPTITGTDDAGAASKVSETGAFTGDAADYVGHYVHNTTDDTYSMITAKDSVDALSIQEDIMDAAEDYEICTAVLNGDDGQVMVEIPQFHYIQYQSSTYRYFLVGDEPFSLILPGSGGTVINSTIHPFFYKGGSSTASDYRYIGAYEASMYDASESAMTAVASIHSNIYAAGDKMCSVSGQYPKTAENIVEYRAMAAARGTGWHQYDHATHAALSMLYLTEYGSFYSQNKIGNGRVSLSNGDWVASEINDGTNYGYIGKCGKSNGDGNATGANNDETDLEVSESPAYMSYRGVENWWGNVWQLMDGANINNDTTASKLYLATDYTAYASDTATGYVFAGNLQEVDGYVGDILDALGVWAKTTGGNSATYITDYYYTEFDTAPAGGWRVVRMGGCADDGANAGAFCVTSHVSSSSANPIFGGRLVY